jgi:hypothetical protein
MIFSLVSAQSAFLNTIPVSRMVKRQFLVETAEILDHTGPHARYFSGLAKGELDSCIISGIRCMNLSVVSL